MTRSDSCNVNVCGQNNGYSCVPLRVGTHKPKKFVRLCTCKLEEEHPDPFQGGVSLCLMQHYGACSFLMESSQKESGGVWDPWWSTVLSRNITTVWPCFCTCAVCCMVTTEQENWLQNGTALPLYGPTFPGMFCSNLPTWMAISVWGIAMHYLLAVCHSTCHSWDSHDTQNVTIQLQKALIFHPHRVTPYHFRKL